MSEASVDKFRKSLEDADSYAEVWQTVKDTVEFSLGKRRGSMMLFLDDLPLQLGAYHSVGTNNIVLNRTLIEIVEASMKDKHVVNALVYNLLLHEYLHALGEMSEAKVRHGVVEVALACFSRKFAKANTVPARQRGARSLDATLWNACSCVPRWRFRLVLPPAHGELGNMRPDHCTPIRCDASQ